MYNKYKTYQNVGEWWKKEGSGKFPIQVPAAIQKLQNDKKISFHEAFECLVKVKAIVFVDKVDNNV